MQPSRCVLCRAVLTSATQQSHLVLHAAVVHRQSACAPVLNILRVQVVVLPTNKAGPVGEWQGTYTSTQKMCFRSSEMLTRWKRRRRSVGHRLHAPVDTPVLPPRTGQHVLCCNVCLCLVTTHLAPLRIALRFATCGSTGVGTPSSLEISSCCSTDTAWSCSRNQRKRGVSDSVGRQGGCQSHTSTQLHTNRTAVNTHACNTTGTATKD